jgi:hypothetical protein
MRTGKRESEETPAKLYDIDDWVERPNVNTPKGGEIVVGAVETYDYPYEPSSLEDLEATRRSLRRVIAIERGKSDEDRRRDKAVTAFLAEIVDSGVSDDERRRRFDRYLETGQISD